MAATPPTPPHAQPHAATPPTPPPSGRTPSTPPPSGRTPPSRSHAAQPPVQPLSRAHAASPLAGDPSAQPLRRRRDELAERVSEEQWDLGGLAYEMAIRDHFRLDVLVRRAAQLQERDAELAEIERLLRLEDSASVGSCPACAAPHSRGALFCWQCGATLMERAPSTAVPAVPAVAAETQDTLVQQSSPQVQAQEHQRMRIAKREGASDRDTHGERDTLIVNPFATEH